MLIKRHEGLRLAQYVDAAGHKTIGYGHLVRPDESYPRPITQAQADALLASDIRVAEKAIDLLIVTPLAQNQHDALVSFTFNLGANALKNSTLRRRINKNDLDVGSEFLKWDKIKDPATGQYRPLLGLTRRRQEESALWCSA